MRAAPAVVACLALAACAATPGPAPAPGTTVPVTERPSASAAPSDVPSPTGSPSPSPTAEPSVRVQLLGTLAVTPGGPPSLQAAAGAQVTTHPGDALQITVTLADDPIPTRLELRLTPGAQEVTVNGGVAVIGTLPDGVLAAVPEPEVLDEDDQPVASALSARDGSLLLMVTPEERHAGAITAELWVGRQVIDEVTVGAERDQPMYAIARTPFGHALLGGGLGSPGARELFEQLGWRQAVALQPALSSPDSLKQQFDCHVLGAPRKQSWNLEAFRLDHPDWMRGALEHRCNWEAEHVPVPTATPGSPSPSASESG
ncbi:DUF2599 domain-containing protein [Tessaracoccus oleiagri]|uniref:DUF2599 domain-containing protein n=1 Tax=Tessaracoccus oleiagri TaxID=686624 RepID=UPI00115FDC15|nr:DUF2599 domain-containing protein [Tessaracoccus oleiagri]